MIFGQLAFGRRLLERMGARFASTFELYESDEGTTGPIPLDSVDEYLAACDLARWRGGTDPAFRALALRSSEVNAMNKLLNAGSSAENVSSVRQ